MKNLLSNVKPNENSKLKRTAVFISIFIVGAIIGGYIFSDTQPRSFLAINRCNNTCLEPKELIGLVNSVIIQKTPILMPKVILETDKTIAIEHPNPQSPYHYVVFPKKDIKNIGQMSRGDEEYIKDMMSSISHLIKEKELTEYQIISNGPGYQETTYLHFHLQATK